MEQHTTPGQSDAATNASAAFSSAKTGNGQGEESRLVLGANDDGELRVESLDPSVTLPPAARTRQQRVRRRWLLSLLLLMLVGVMILVNANALLAFFHHDATTAQVRLPFCGSAAFRSQSVTPAGWHHAGPTCARQLVFAPNAPAVAYSCDTPGLPEPNVPVAMTVSVSHDSGHSWHTHKTPAMGVNCNLTINPINPQDVFLMVYDQCSSCTQYPPMSLYRSEDGGSHWSRWLLPDPQVSFTGYYWAWVGSTFYLAPYFAVTASPRRTIDQLTPTANGQALAASIAGQAFVWVQQGMLKGLSADTNIQQLIGLNTSLYVMLDSLSTCVPTCLQIRATSDNAATWLTVTPEVDGYQVTLTGANAEGTALYGYYLPADGVSQPDGNTLYVRSSDGGMTWQQLPPLIGDPSTASFTEVPDGTIYVQIAQVSDTSTTIIIEKLPPAAASWIHVTQFTDNSMQLFVLGEWELAVSWNSAGHAETLWSPIFAWEPDRVRPGLQTHSA